MNLDLIAAAVVGWLAVALFTLHVLSSQKRQHWVNLPKYVRHGLWVAGAVCMVRSVNLFTLADRVPPARGQVNWEGFALLLALTYVFSSLAVWAALKYAPPIVWEKLRWVEQRERANPQAVTLVLEPHEFERLALKDDMLTNGLIPPGIEMVPNQDRMGTLQ